MKLGLFFLFSIIFTFSSLANASLGRPRKYPTDQEIQKTFEAKSSVAKYRGQSGYLEFADAYFDSNLQVCFQYVSKALGRTFASLEWIGFGGTTHEYSVLRDELTSSDLNTRNKLMGVAGYVQFSDTHDAGKMLKSFVNASAVLSESEFAQLGWGKSYLGTTLEYSNERERLLSDGKAKPEFQGPLGYQKYADTHHAGKMLKSFVNASAVLSESEFAQLGWGKQYQGTTLEYSNERERLLSDGKAKPEFQGPLGYQKYADTHHAGKMQKSFVNASAVLSESEFAQLGWGKSYLGTTLEYSNERERLLSDGKAKPEFQGPLGYQKYADRHHAGKMQKSSINASAVLSESEFAQLAWGKQYQGTTLEYSNERERLLSDGKAKPEFQGPLGYQKYADTHHAGKMQKSFLNASAVLSESEFAQLGWGSVFLGSTIEYAALRDFLFSAGQSGAVARWFGKGDGLPKLVDAYLFSIEAKLPYTKTIRDKMRFKFRTVVTEDELRALGWHSVSAGRGTCADELKAG